MMELYRQMQNACHQIGVKILSDDTCCRLLAVVFKFGDESAVYSEIMRMDIREAQARAGILPGMVPDEAMIWKVKRYGNQIERGCADWLAGLEARYGVTFPELSPMPDREKWKERVHGGIWLSQGQHGETGQR